MVVFLLKIIFLTISTLSNLVTRVCFTAVASLLVLFIYGFKVPGEAAQGILQQVGEAIKGCLEYILELLIEAIKSLISSVFDALIAGVTGSAAAAGSAAGDLVEKTRTSLQGLLEDLPEVAAGFSEMISTIVSDLWNNFNDALAYVTGNS
jgi:phage-related protein